MAADSPIAYRAELPLQRKLKNTWATGVALTLCLSGYLSISHADLSGQNEFLPETETEIELDAAIDPASALQIMPVERAGDFRPMEWPDDPAPDVTPEAEPFIVMIDPGHGGSDPGSEAPNGLLEKELTLDIAERVQLFLGEVEGLQVLMTRQGDRGLSRQNRVNRIRNSGSDLVVSLHFNHLPQKDVTLVESFYADQANIRESLEVRRLAGENVNAADGEADLTFTEGSARLATMVQNRVFNEVRTARSDAIDAGAKRDTLFVLTRSFVPGALVELTCISNPAEAERLTTDAYRNELAAAIADAVRDYRESVQKRPLGAFDV